MEEASAYRLVLVTAPETAVPAISQALVTERLAACVNALPGLLSTYRWEGAVESAEEVLLLIKTRAHLLPRLEGRLRELHPYEVPEIIALTLSEGSSPYLDWISENTLASEDDL